MKRYDVFCRNDIESVPDENGDWVPASVAQALYDALYNALHCLGDEFALPADIIDDIEAAISLADGGE